MAIIWAAPAAKGFEVEIALSTKGYEELLASATKDH